MQELQTHDILKCANKSLALSRPYWQSSSNDYLFVVRIVVPQGIGTNTSNNATNNSSAGGFRNGFTSTAY
jgi:hypothetical protein